MSEEATKVVFRKFKEGDVIAIFPQIPGTNNAYDCDSYMLNGGHCSCDPHGIISITTLATEEEYKETRRVLENHYEYKLRPMNRIVYDDLLIRRAKIKEQYNAHQTD